MRNSRRLVRSGHAGAILLTGLVDRYESVDPILAISGSCRLRRRAARTLGSRDRIATRPDTAPARHPLVAKAARRAGLRRPHPQHPTQPRSTSSGSLAFGVGLLVLVVALAGSGDVQFKLGDDVFEVGDAETFADRIADDAAPIPFSSLSGNRPIYLQHIGDDPTTGWYAIDARSPSDPDACVLEWVDRRPGVRRRLRPDSHVRARRRGPAALWRDRR